MKHYWTSQSTEGHAVISAAVPVSTEQVNMILEIARWAPSGANSQPWSYIVIRNPDIRKQLFESYCTIDMDLMWWMEQMRSPEYRHGGYSIDCDDPDEGLKIKQTRPLWRDAPVIIAVVGDGRKQWGTVQGGHTMGLDQTHLTDGAFKHLHADSSRGLNPLA